MTQGDADDRLDPADRLRRAERSSPDAVWLAVLCSAAARVEPELLRDARLELAATVSASAEAELWFGPLVQSRSAIAITLMPAVLPLLRDRLMRAGNGLPQRAREVVRRAHAAAPALLRLEEEITWQSLAGSGRAGVRDGLLRLLATATHSPAPGVLRWTGRLLERLPADALAIDAATALRMIAAPVMDEPASDTDLSPARCRHGADLIAAVSPAATRLRTVYVALFEDHLLITPLEDHGRHAVDVVAGDPVRLRVSWGRGPSAVSHDVAMSGDSAVTLPCRAERILIHTAVPRAYVLKRSTETPDKPPKWMTPPRGRFQRDLMTQAIEGNIPRREVDSVTNWLTESNGPNVLVIAGPGGIGKTAIAAKACVGYRFVVAYFATPRQPLTQHWSAVLRAVTRGLLQSSRTRSSYTRQLVKSLNLPGQSSQGAIVNAVEQVLCFEAPENALDRLLTTPLSAVVWEAPAVLLDGVLPDEPSEDGEPYRRLLSSIGSLPLRLVVTASTASTELPAGVIHVRPLEYVPSDMSDMLLLLAPTQEKASRSMLRKYKSAEDARALRFAADLRQQGQPPQGLREAIVSVENATSLDDLRAALQRDIAAFSDRNPIDVRRLLGVLSAAREAIELDELSATHGQLLPDVVANCLDRLGPLVRTTSDRPARYALKYDLELFVDSAEARDLTRRGHVAFTQRVHSAFTGNRPFSRYLIRHAVPHLLEAGDSAMAKEVCRRSDWLLDKARRHGAAALADDLDAVAVAASAEIDNDESVFDSAYYAGLRRAVHCTAAALTADPDQIVGQLIAYVSKPPPVERAADAAETWLRPQGAWFAHDRAGPRVDLNAPTFMANGPDSVFAYSPTRGEVTHHSGGREVWSGPFVNHPEVIAVAMLDDYAAIATPMFVTDRKDSDRADTRFYEPNGSAIAAIGFAELAGRRVWVVLNADGELCVPGEKDGPRSLRWDVGRHSPPLLAVAARRGTAFTAALRGGVNEWDLATGMLVTRWPGGPPSVLTVMPDGQVLTFGHGRRLSVWKRPLSSDGPAAGPAPPIELRAQRGDFLAASLTDDGSRLATTTTAGDVEWWDTLTGRRLCRFTLPSALPSVAVTGDGRDVVAADAHGGWFAFDVIETPTRPIA